MKTFSTSDANKIAVKSNRFRGTIFTAAYNTGQFIITTDSVSRFTPNQEDIFLAETILKDQIKEINKGHPNQLLKREYIEKNLSKYFRQYVGFTNSNGERIVHINMHWDRFSLSDRISGYWDSRLDYTSDYSIVFDGGSRYWSINVNLNSKKLFGLSVNGIA